MFTKTIIRQGEKIIKLDRENKKLQADYKELLEENKALYTENKDNRYELLELEDYKNKNEKLKKNMIQKLIRLQEINRLGTLEEDKNKNRNIIINALIKELSAANR